MGNMGLEAAKGHVIQHYLLPACILANFHPCLTHRAYGQCQRKNHDTFPRFSSFLPLSTRMTSKRPLFWVLGFNDACGEHCCEVIPRNAPVEVTKLVPKGV